MRDCPTCEAADEFGWWGPEHRLHHFILKHLARQATTSSDSPPPAPARHFLSHPTGRPNPPPPRPDPLPPIPTTPLAPDKRTPMPTTEPMPKSTPFRPLTIQIPQELYDRLAELADQEQRSISNMLRVIATRYLDGRDDAGATAATP